MSFEQGLSGLNAASANLGAIGNNVANANTVGFKQSQAQFADMFAASMSGGGAGQIGTGVSVSNIAQQFTQGNITATTNPLDTAINGQGFFQMTTPAGATVYSRNGQFQLDKNGFMVNAQGAKINGYMPNAAGVLLAGAVVPLQINPANLPPKASALVTAGLNMNSAAPVPATAVFSPTDPTSYTNSTSMSVYDSLGASHIGTMYFQRQPVAPTTAPAIIPAAATTAALASVAGLSVGTIPGAGVAGAALAVTISGITPGVAPAGTVTFTPATTTATAAGAAITTNAPSANWNTYLTVDGVTVPATPASTVPLATVIGATGATLASAAGLAVGTNITIAGNPGALTLTAVNLVTGAVTLPGHRQPPWRQLQGLPLLRQRRR
ncbi:MAG: flagellar hook-basal body complex protein [Proteobacteria bacterium]|nr:flagellar hook-basal body complex protein [Pseudomonadota bacterium]